MIAPYAYYGASGGPYTNYLSYLGFTYYDASGDDGQPTPKYCDCTKSVLSQKLSPETLTIPNFDEVAVTVDASLI